MPRPVDPAIEDAKLNGGIHCDLIHLDFDTPRFYTNGAIDVDYGGNTYEANGVLLRVDSGAMSTGSQTNDWELDLSIADPVTLSAILGTDPRSKWVYHYRAWFKEDDIALTFVGAEARKFGRVHVPGDIDKPGINTSKLTLTVSNPIGNTQSVDCLHTNEDSQHRKVDPLDRIFFAAHETNIRVKTMPTTIGGTMPGDTGGNLDDFGNRITL